MKVSCGYDQPQLALRSMASAFSEIFALMQANRKLRRFEFKNPDLPLFSTLAVAH